MARIIDAEQFISQYPFKAMDSETEITIELDDPMADWNKGIFTLHVSKTGEGKLSPSTNQPEVSLDIQTLTTMLLSYKRPPYLAEIGRLNGDEKLVQRLESIIKRDTPYFSDYF